MTHKRLNWFFGLLTCGGLATAQAAAEVPAAAFSLAPAAAAIQLVEAVPAPALPEATAAPAVATDPCCEPCCTTKPVQLTLGFRTWFTQGNSDDVIRFGSGALNQFRFRDLEATVYEFNVDAVVLDRFIARVDLGFGTIDAGNFNVVNNPSPVPPGPSIDLSNDDLFYVTADLGYRLFSRNNPDATVTKLSCDAFVGYQHWHETYVVTDLLNAPLFNDKYSWDSLRLGVRGSVELGRFAAQARAAYVPWTRFGSKSTDLTLSGGDFQEKADGGHGVMADFTLSYRVWRGLSVDVGYQVFHLASDAGTFQDAGRELPMGNARSTRHGLLLGLNYRF